MHVTEEILSISYFGSGEILEALTLIKEGSMLPKTKVYLFMKIFFGIFSFYLLLLLLFPHSSLAQMASLFQSVSANFVFLVFSFLFIALGFSGIVELVDFSHRKSLRMGWYRPKVGKVLVSEGHITKGELRDALSEQRLRLGEVLVRAGRITAGQLNEALDYQKKVSRKLGEILKQLGHSTEQDINWALRRMKRKLGEILQEKGLLTNYELISVLAFQEYGPIRA